jgi:hypothetical protein
MKSIIILAGIAAAFTPACLEHKLRSTLDDGFCQRAVEYQKPAGVDYEPGVDASGKPVVEADLNKSPVQMPDVVRIPVTIDLAQYLGLPSTIAKENYAVLGELVFENGAFTYNGDPLDGKASESLRKLCATEKPAKPPEKPLENKHNQH